MSLKVDDALVGPLGDLILSVADDKLMLGHCASDWTGLGPILEEDIAFSAISQEEIAHASELYNIIGPILGRSADQLAFGRSPGAYRCAHITQLPDEFDWARAIVRQFLCDRFDHLRLTRLSRSSLVPLADLARRIAAEEATHVEHGDTWVVHLARGSEESAGRMQQAFEFWAQPASMLFEPTEGVGLLESAGVYPVSENEPHDMFVAWKEGIDSVLQGTGLSFSVSAPDGSKQGGRKGLHTDGFDKVLDEMCEVYRVEPEAQW